MESAGDIFSGFGIFDVIDILLVAFLIYLFFSLVRGTIAVNILIGLFLIFLFYLLVRALEMRLMTGIFDKVASVGVIALIIVFQEEIRRFLLMIGRNSLLNSNKGWLRFLFGQKTLEGVNYDKIKPIIEACRSMKNTKTGALIVFARNIDGQDFFNNGEILNATLSKRLLESIFSKNGPLHDGAVVIADSQVVSASCVLPLTSNTELPARLGLRHRAAIGITEVSDSSALVISEETGEISYAKYGRIRTNISLLELEKFLQRDMS